MSRVDGGETVADAMPPKQDAALDGSTSQLPDAAPADATTDAAPVVDTDSGTDASLADAASGDAGADAGDADSACGPELSCADIDFSASRYDGSTFFLRIPYGFSIDSGTVSGTVDQDLSCVSPEPLTATLNYDSEGAQLYFTAPASCPIRSCGGLTVTITDDCGHSYDVAISQLTVDDCEASSPVVKGSCGT